MATNQTTKKIETNKTTVKKRKPTTKKDNQAYKPMYLLLGLAIFFFSVVALFNWGFFGLMFANTFRLFVGEAYTLLLSLITIFSFVLIIKGRLIIIRGKQLIGGVLVMASITTLLHFNTFFSEGATANTIFSLTFDIFRNELLTSQNYQSLGGGMLGATFYAGFGYLFGQWGTYLLVFMLFFAGLFMVVDCSIEQLLSAGRQLVNGLFASFNALFPNFEQIKHVFNRVEVTDKDYVPAIEKKKAQIVTSQQVNQDKLEEIEVLKTNTEQKSPFFEKLFKPNKVANYADPKVKSATFESSYQPSIERETKTNWQPYTARDTLASTAASERKTLVLDLDYFDEMTNMTSRVKGSQESSEETKQRQIPIVQAESLNTSPPPEESLTNATVLELPEEMPATGQTTETLNNMAAAHWQEGSNKKQDLTQDDLDVVLSESEAASKQKQEVKKPKRSKAYQLPSKKLLNKIAPVDQSEEYERININIDKLEKTFESFGVKAVVVKANLGPSVTKYEIEPAIGVKVSKIVSLSDDIALALAARDIRMEAPIPGKSLIGIEVPNNQVSPVSFAEIIEAGLESPNILEVPLGRDISGTVCLADLSKMPHLLMAGATGSGKSVGMNVIIVSLLMKAKPDEVKFLMIDPKKVELTMYDGIPHLLSPVVTNPRKAAKALNNIVQEMERRYELFAATGVRNVDSYNEQIDTYNAEEGTGYERLPKIVVFIDELADLMMVASNEVENAIIRLAQMARAAGIHMIIATQRPSVDVITGIIKANVPSRLAFAVSSGTDSRTILDSNGAEKLLGRGDMLFQPMGKNKPVRVQGAYISDSEVERITEFIKDQQDAEYDETIMVLEEDTSDSAQLSEDEYFEDAVELIKGAETVSISHLQRKFRIGYNRAARLIDDLEAIGYVGAQDGSKPRQVLIGDQPLDV
ncbi:DNA translocase FtsK [Fundicoccus sp. Sow4_D5]|uniref:DNA translocase FtsK n=1 Tax=unclassified Fundicoccus TaxID=2761543 RepID=UPI003F93965B